MGLVLTPSKLPPLHFQLLTQMVASVGPYMLCTSVLESTWQARCAMHLQVSPPCVERIAQSNQQMVASVSIYVVYLCVAKHLAGTLCYAPANHTQCVDGIVKINPENGGFCWPVNVVHLFVA